MASRFRSSAGTGVSACLAALAIAACGDAFTAGDDGGTPPGSDASFDASMDTGTVDGEVDDATRPRDAEGNDAVASDGGGGGDAIVPPLDGSIVGDAASLCLKTCPPAFDCVLGRCVDRAAPNFTALGTMANNWSYGSFAQFGSSAFSPYTETWTLSGPNSVVFISRTKNTLAPSVFHNNSLAAASYAGMKIPGGALALYPPPMTTVDSVVRWTAPASGHYAVDATFTGIGTMPVTMVGASVNIGPAVVMGGVINGAMQTFTYSNADLGMVLQGSTIDFYVNFMTATDDAQGGTSLDAKITAN